MIIHFIHHPVSAKKFVEPLVNCLNENNFEAELWVENRKGYEQFIKRIVCPVRFCNFDIPLNPVRFISRIFTISRKLKKLKPDAVHAHQTRAALIPLLAAKLSGVQTRIYHNHGLPYLGYKGLFRKSLFLLEKINCLLATHVITVSPSLKRIMERDLKISHCVVLGSGSACGINLDEFNKELFSTENKIKNRSELGIHKEDFVVFFCGRPVKRKGIEVLFKAWEKFNLNRNSVLLLAGVCESDMKPKWKSLAGIKPLGLVTDVLKLYSACDIVVLPSFHEGASYAILEAFAASRMVIACDIPGNDCLVKHRYNGFMVESGNWMDLKKSLEDAKKMEAAKCEMEVAARQFIEEKFDRKICQANLIKFYSELKL